MRWLFARFWRCWDRALYHVEDEEPMRSEFVAGRTSHQGRRH